MHPSIELLLRLLEGDDPVIVAREDIDGALGEALNAWRQAGFLDSEPGSLPVPSCPHCEDGVPYRVGAVLCCNACHSVVEPSHLLAWQLHRDRFLMWLAAGLDLKGDVRVIDGYVWQLGTWMSGEVHTECFYVRSGVLSDVGRRRLSAYHNALVLYGTTPPPAAEEFRLPSASLLELLQLGPSLAVSSLDHVFRSRGKVRFDAESGALWSGDALLGEVPVGSREFHFLHCLACNLDHFVPYADLKREVLRHTGGTDGTEEATFCQRLKNRIKTKWVPTIDRLIVTTNKADGYRLRGLEER